MNINCTKVGHKASSACSRLTSLLLSDRAERGEETADYCAPTICRHCAGCAHTNYFTLKHKHSTDPKPGKDTEPYVILTSLALWKLECAMSPAHLLNHRLFISLYTVCPGGARLASTEDSETR